MATTTPYVIGPSKVKPWNPELGGYAWEDTGGFHYEPLTKTDLMKAIGDAINGIKDWIVNNIVPFVIGILGIIFVLFVVTKVFG